MLNRELRRFWEASASRGRGGWVGRGGPVHWKSMTGNLFEDIAPAESTNEWFTAHCDGGSRGNPGPSGYGAVIEDGQGQIAARLSKFLGIQTNNYAEYSGLLAVLQWALDNGK